jgi:non-ribosomal peptide synthetase component E (peptide arylation enzyme)
MKASAPTVSKRAATCARTFAAIVLPLALAACMANDATPSQVPAGAPGLVNDYPNLNLAPTPATAQLTDEERDAATAELRSLRDRQASGRRLSSSEAERLRQLARTHGDNTLGAIGAQ